ncbi:hypothetical protein [Bordetella genomosp. 13]|uniref:hypothetical protein n=1 Tax=Bordetella genomosp. 13 TaxID=463040 RepID=UPI0011A15E86|nr:hypothetical protein [Bordetella genomosp. 13]
MEIVRLHTMDASNQWFRADRKHWQQWLGGLANRHPFARIMQPERAPALHALKEDRQTVYQCSDSMDRAARKQMEREKQAYARRAG